jgi:hypothetical protein
VPLPGKPLSTGTITDAFFRSLSSGTGICMQSTRSSPPYSWARHGSSFHLLDHVSGSPHVVPGLLADLDGTRSLGVVVLEALLGVVLSVWSGFALAP